MTTDMEQIVLLTTVRTLHLRLKAAKLDARAAARQAVLLEMAPLSHELDLAIRRAFEGGVSKRQIGLKGLLTQDPNGVPESLKRTARFDQTASDAA